MSAIRKLVPTLALVAASIAAAGSAWAAEEPQQVFWERLSALCGQAFAGTVTGFSRPADDAWLGQELVMHVRRCSETEIRIPLHLGDDRSRTWVVTRLDDGLRLKHDHRHEGGGEDALTWYGGHTTDSGRDWRQTFPADDYSMALFLANGLEVSTGNFWSMEVRPGDVFAYELTRSGRMFRAEFDLAEPVEAPPAPWGHN